jgi:tetratricopeptide (TPR) repeat protein
MRRVLVSVTLLPVFLAAAPAARGGVYNLAQRRAFAGRGSEDRDVRKQLEDMPPQNLFPDAGALASINDNAPTAKQKETWTADRRLAIQKVDALEAKQKEGPLALADIITLSAYYIRLGREEKARRLLEKTDGDLDDKDPYKFLVLLNLAATYELTPEFLERAVETEKQALKLWPKEWKGWSADDLAWYRIAERYYLAFLEARLLEVQRNRGVTPPVIESVAPIFPKARFDEPGREYQAGSFGPETADALPLDAFQVVVQLLLWLPNDTRVRWLCAEVLNGRGNIPEAKAFMIDVRDIRNVAAARPHLRVLMEWQPPDQPQTQAAPMPTSDLWVPDWRQIGGSFFAGVVVTALAFLQWRQWARRH